MRQHESQRPDDVRRDAPKHFALEQRLAHQPKLVIFEIAQAAVNQLARRARRRAGQIALFAKKHRPTAADGVAGDAAAIDAAADDGDVDGGASIGWRDSAQFPPPCSPMNWLDRHRFS